ncbi:AQJ64_40280 family protein [Actinomadura keratinilytica]
MPVAAAITGRYPAEGDDGDRASGEEFWLVRPMYYTDRYETPDGVTHHHCFVDSDEVVRFPYDRDSDDSVTHWAELPTLPGTDTHFLGGQDVGPRYAVPGRRPPAPEPCRRTATGAAPSAPDGAAPLDVGRQVGVATPVVDLPVGESATRSGPPPASGPGRPRRRRPVRVRPGAGPRW